MALTQSGEGLKRVKRPNPDVPQEERILVPIFGYNINTSLSPQLACPTDFVLASLHNHENQLSLTHTCTHTHIPYWLCFSEKPWPVQQVRNIYEQRSLAQSCKSRLLSPTPFPQTHAQPRLKHLQTLIGTPFSLQTKIIQKLIYKTEEPLWL